MPHLNAFFGQQPQHGYHLLKSGICYRVLRRKGSFLVEIDFSRYCQIIQADHLCYFPRNTKNFDPHHRLIQQKMNFSSIQSSSPLVILQSQQAQQKTAHSLIYLVALVYCSRLKTPSYCSFFRQELEYVPFRMQPVLPQLTARVFSRLGLCSQDF